MFLKRKKKSFGFSMTTEEGDQEGMFRHLVTEVEPNGSAKLAGIQDRVFRISFYFFPKFGQEKFLPGPGLLEKFFFKRRPC